MQASHPNWGENYIVSHAHRDVYAGTCATFALAVLLTAQIWCHSFPHHLAQEAGVSAGCLTSCCSRSAHSHQHAQVYAAINCLLLTWRRHSALCARLHGGFDHLSSKSVDTEQHSMQSKSAARCKHARACARRAQQCRHAAGRAVRIAATERLRQWAVRWPYAPHAMARCI